MPRTPHVDQSLALVRRAVHRIGKKPLAARAAVAAGVLRRLELESYSPTVRTLRKLETVAAEVEREAQGGAK